MNGGAGDDEPAMAYFLPNGITDDSPPKRSRFKASFGPIGGRAAAASTNIAATTIAGATPTPTPTSASSTASRAEMDFGGGLHLRPRPTLDASPFGAAASSSSPRPTNFLLSDLGGEIHTPRAQREFGEAADALHTSSRPFGFSGRFGSGLSETQHGSGAIGGGAGSGAIRSPSSMFDRGQEVAKSFSMHRSQHFESGNEDFGGHHSPHLGDGDRSFRGDGRSHVGASSAFNGDSVVTPSLYRGSPATTLSSYLGPGDPDSPFASAPIRTWPSSASEAAQPRRVLQRPPGLSPPGLGEDPINGLPTRMRLGSGGGSDMMQQRASSTSFGGFQPTTSSPMAASGGLSKATAFSSSSNQFEASDNQFGASLLPQLPDLRLAADVFGNEVSRGRVEERMVSNPDLAELNTHSVKVDEMEGVGGGRAVDSPSVPWDSGEPTMSRRIDIQARYKTPRSPKKTREGRKKAEARSDMRARALGANMEATGAFTPGSPVKSRRNDRGRNLASAESLLDSSPMSMEHLRRAEGGTVVDQPAPRGKRRGQAGEKGKTSSRSVSAGSSATVSDTRRKGTTKQSDSSGVVAPGSDSGDSPVKPPSRESGKSRRRDGGGDAKPTSRNVASKRNSTRGTDKGTGTSRRQVYREKLSKEGPKGVPQKEEVASTVESPSTCSNSPKGSQTSSDDHKSEPKNCGRKEKVAHDAGSKESPGAETKAVSSFVETTAVAEVIVAKALEVPDSSEELSRGETAEVVRKSGDMKVIKAHAKPIVDEVSNSSVESEVSQEIVADVETGSSTSSDVPEENHAVIDAQSEPQHELVVETPSAEESASPAESSESDAESPPVRAADAVVASKKAKRKDATSSDESPSVPDAESPATPEPPQLPTAEKKHVGKEQRKDKPKKDKADKRKASKSKKDKRNAAVASKSADTVGNLTSDVQDKELEALAKTSIPISTRINKGLRMGGSAAASYGLSTLSGTLRGCSWVAGRLNLKGVISTSVSSVESVLAVVFSVVLLLSLHAASWFIRVHRVAFRAILTHRHIGFCFAFLYAFPFLVQYVFPWAPPWAPVCLWYAFLVQLFCTNGPTAMVTTFRVILPLVFLVEGISHHSFLLDLNGACQPYQIGIGDEEELSCHPLSMHHSIADYNNHPAPSSAVSIQKTKRLDRRALAYVRGRKMR
ncbi:hypothetical protein BBJ28_00000072 [Nothophytophthora sp. Chile5]|nr:hypothetical protein BBJ28_00000072 [Nothophytophthora sp. Chile5]